MCTFYTCVVLKGVTCQIVCSICCFSFWWEQNDCIIMIVCYVHSLSFMFAMDFHHVALHVGMLGWKRDAMRFEKIAAEVNLETVPWIPCKLQGGSWKFGFVWDGDIFQISLTDGSSGISWLVKLYNPSKKQWCIECYITIDNINILSEGPFVLQAPESLWSRLGVITSRHWENASNDPCNLKNVCPLDQKVWRVVTKQIGVTVTA